MKNLTHHIKEKQETFEVKNTIAPFNKSANLFQINRSRNPSPAKTGSGKKGLLYVYEKACRMTGI